MHWREDIRFGIRMLGRNRTLTIIAVLSLGLGIGLNSAIFSAVSGILWSKLPYPEPDRLVALYQSNQAQGFSDISVSIRDCKDWSEAKSFESVAAYRTSQVVLSSGAEPQSTVGLAATAGLFRTIGVAPAIGRGFTEDEARRTEAGQVALLSDGLWRRQFGADASILQRTIRLDGRNFTVIGVMPPGFQFLYTNADVIVPLALPPEQAESRRNRSFQAIGRLAPGVSVAQAADEVKAISRRIEQEDREDAGYVARVVPIEQRLIDFGARLSINTLWAGVGFVLLIACANIANLLLARGMLRSREMAIRAALGAGRGRLVQLLLMESVVLSLAGGVVGILFAAWATPTIRNMAPQDLPRIDQVQLNPTVLVYALGLSLLTGLLSGLAPALALSRGELAQSLHSGGRGSTRSRQRLLKVLVVAEVALALVLLTGGGLLVRSFIREMNAYPGFDKNNLMTARVSLPQPLYPEPRQAADFFARAIESLNRDRLVKGAAAVQTPPLAGSNSYERITVDSAHADPNEIVVIGWMVVTTGYFRTMGIPLLAGRDMDQRDSLDAARVAVINQNLARRFWPDDPAPIGKRFKQGPADSKEPWITVIGVAGDVQHRGPSRPVRPEVYVPHAQFPRRGMVLVARATGEPAAVAQAMRAAVRAVDPGQPLFRLQTLEEIVDARRAGPRITAQLLGLMAWLALLLAALGIYGVIAYNTNQRMREIGVRLALGALPGSIFRLVLRSGLVLAGIGLAIGLAGAHALTPLLRSIIPAVNPHDAGTFSGAAVLLLLAAFVACALPARRAMRVNPLQILRDE